MIKAKINVSKISKSHLFKGKSGLYLNIALIETHDDKYGNDYMVVQDLGPEAAARKERGPILGNAKNIFRSDKPQAPPPPQQPLLPDDTDVPF